MAGLQGPRARARREAGFSILEMVLSFSILTIVTLGIVEGFAFAQKSLVDNQMIQRRTQEISNLIDSIRMNIRLYQAHWDPALDPREELNKKELPLAWNGNMVTDAAKCELCPGRLGFIIQPHPDDFMRGVYVVTIKVTHTTLYPEPRFFQFMASLR